jgi:hypothetical protein
MAPHGKIHHARRQVERRRRHRRKGPPAITPLTSAKATKAEAGPHQQAAQRGHFLTTWPPFAHRRPTFPTPESSVSSGRRDRSRGVAYGMAKSAEPYSANFIAAGMPTDFITRQSCRRRDGRARRRHARAGARGAHRPRDRSSATHHHILDSWSAPHSAHTDPWPSGSRPALITPARRRRGEAAGDAPLCPHPLQPAHQPTAHPRRQKLNRLPRTPRPNRLRPRRQPAAPTTADAQ